MRRLLFAILLPAVTAVAEPPAGYYDSAAGLTGSALKAALNDIIDGHTVIIYANVFPPLKELWENPANVSQVRLIYGGTFVSESAFTWNREHLWPRSRGVNPGAAEFGGPDDSDLFNLAPCDADVNSNRSNLFYDESSAADGGFSDPAHVEAPLCSKDANSWEPPANEKGDIARAMFYMATRYDGTEADTTDLELVSATPSGSQMANLATLLEWHVADPPDAAELARNDLIYTDYQHNRNPFVDHPEYASAIWGTPSAGINAQAGATIVTAVETPSSNASFTVTLTSAAPVGGLVVGFTMSGSAVAADYALSGSGVTFTPGTLSGAITFSAGTTSRTVSLAPTVDGPDNNETAILSLNAGAGYTVIGVPATVTIIDVPPPAAGGVIASWAFDATPFPAGSIPPSSGSASLSTAAWGGTITNFAGLNGTQSLALVGNAGNGTYIEFTLNTAGWANPGLSYWTRRSGSGFNNHNWRWSADGVNFTSIAGNYGPDDILFEVRTVDLGVIPPLQNAPSAKLRVYLSGATDANANNRLEDIVFTGVKYSADWLTRFPAFTGAATAYTGDSDHDGLENFGEWAFDLNPLAGSPAPAVAGTVNAPDPADGNLMKTWPAITFTRRTDAPQITYAVEQGSDLENWSSGCVFTGAVPGTNAGTERATFRATTPVGGAPVFMRVRASQP